VTAVRSGIQRLLATGPWPLDGGLASELEARGHDLSDDLWSARLLRDDPDAIRAVHAAYFAAGARVAISASYQASRRGFAAVGLDARAADRLLTRSVELAREARDAALAAGRPGPLLVAASVGPYGAVLADGAEYRGRYGLPHADLVAFHRERLEVLAAAGPDLLAVETVPDAAEVAAVVEVLADHPELPAWVSLSCASGSRTCAGDRVEDAATTAAAAATVLAVGVNCTAPEHVSELLPRIRGATGLPLVVYPNAGRVWDGAARCWTGSGADELPDAADRAWVAGGAALVGGCCGLGPTAVAGLERVLAPLRAGHLA
jgi:S-methylmethionine-dependent homocysteine/selenocysteine methylase